MTLSNKKIIDKDGNVFYPESEVKLFIQKIIGKVIIINGVSLFIQEGNKVVDIIEKEAGRRLTSKSSDGIKK